MTVVREPGLAHQALRAGLMALCLLSLADCSDGYPTEDNPQIDPARMSQAQLMAALNSLGEEPYLGKRWRYALHANCELEVSVRNGSTDRRRVGLEGAELSTRAADGVTEILLVPRPGGNAQSVSVLATPKWTDTVEARLLFAHLDLRCDGPGTPTA